MCFFFTQVSLFYFLIARRPSTALLSVWLLTFQDQFQINSLQRILKRRGFQQIKERVLYQLKIITKFKNHLLQNYFANFNQTQHKASLDEGDSSKFKWKATFFVEILTKKLICMHWRILKIFSRTNMPISSKLATKHSLIKGIQVFTNGGHALFQDEIKKITMTIFFLPNHGANFNQTWQNHP